MDKAIALIDASKDETKYGFKIFNDMINAGWNVKGINTRGGEVLDRKIYYELDKLEVTPNIVITVVPPEST